MMQQELGLLIGLLWLHAATVLGAWAGRVHSQPPAATPGDVLAALASLACSYQAVKQLFFHVAVDAQTLTFGKGDWVHLSITMLDDRSRTLAHVVPAWYLAAFVAPFIVGFALGRVLDKIRLRGRPNRKPLATG